MLSGFLSLLSDISQNEYLSLSIRWVDSSYDVHEDTLGLIPLPDIAAIKDVLTGYSFPFLNVGFKH